MNIELKEIKLVPATSLRPNPKNRNTHSEEQIKRLCELISYQGFRQPIIVSNRTGLVVAGHGRLEAAAKLNIQSVPVAFQDFDSEEQEYAFGVSDNAIASWSELDLAGINSDMLDFPSFNIDLLGIKDFTLDGDQDSGGAVDSRSGNLCEKFLVPPFSVLDTRQGYWLERKRAWIARGIRSEEGRDGSLLGLSAAEEMKVGSYNGGGAFMGAGTSIFDPVVCELAYRWFAPIGGTVLDPFAGGSVRGVVASLLGYQYVGCELRKEQVEANRAQGMELCKEPMPVWQCGDSRKLDVHCAGVHADLIFSCPPYADLEVYSDDPNDISNMEYNEFCSAYGEIIKKAVSQLKPDRFVVWVVGEVREGKAGLYRNFVPKTIELFETAGARFYNEIILVSPIGTLALRAGRYFSSSRKIGKTHQNVLVFCKGDPIKAAKNCGEIKVELPNDGLEMQEVEL